MFKAFLVSAVLSSCLLGQSKAFLPATTTISVSSSASGQLSDAQIEEAIQRGLSNSRHSLGLSLNDRETSMMSGFGCKTCRQSGYTVKIYTPEQWVELAARRAKREMQPFSQADVPVEMRQPMLHIVALPSTPEYLNGAGFSGASSVHRVVLSDTARQITIQPIDLANGAVQSQSAFRSAEFGTATASFAMADVSKLRAADTNGEFFVVVVGDRQNKFFKVKSRFLDTLFSTEQPNN